MKKPNYKTMVRHGELLIVPVTELPTNAESISSGKDYIIGHSETGHHHIAVADSVEMFKSKGVSDLFMKIAGGGRVEHKKAFHQHETKVLPDGFYRIYNKTEFDYLANVKKQVRD